MITKVLYIDDEITRPGRDAWKIKELLDVPRKFNCDLQRPPEKFSKLPELPDALLVDLDLSTVLINNEPVDYYGSTLASEVRMRNPARPIILITGKEPLATEKRPILEESKDIDLILHKNDIIKNPEAERARIIGLVEGFKALEEISGKAWEKVLDLMEANDDEKELLRETSPPVTPQRQWNISRTARWIRNVVMRYPGILYDDLWAATRLGISLKSFRKPNVQRLMKPARYAGVFSSYAERWWRGRLFSIAQELLSKQNVQGPISQGFAEAFHRRFQEKLSPAICVYDETPVADWVCHILQKPVKQKNSIPYYPNNRPAVMEQARVSRKAIEESEAFDENLVDADAYEVVKKAWELD